MHSILQSEIKALNCKFDGTGDDKSFIQFLESSKEVFHSGRGRVPTSPTHLFQVHEVSQGHSQGPGCQGYLEAIANPDARNSISINRKRLGKI